MNRYLPILKTSDAELRALGSLKENTKSSITPILELTRSRSSVKYPSGIIERRLKKVREVCPRGPFILDLTTDPFLVNDQIRSLQSNLDGYKEWVDFVCDLKSSFPDLIPMIQVNDEGIEDIAEYENSILRQVKVLMDNFEKLAFRFRYDYEEYFEDIKLVSRDLEFSRLICIIDAEYIPPEKAEIYYSEILKKIKKISILDPYINIVVSGTSFPLNPTEYGGDLDGESRIEEWLGYKNIINEYESIIYSDYATIHPIRSPQAGGGGWVPRIDLVEEARIIYERSRKTSTETSYATAYTRVANKIIKRKEFSLVKKMIGNAWGIEQIELAACGNPPGLSPSFWISVRMNIHMEVRVKLLNI